MFSVNSKTHPNLDWKLPLKAAYKSEQIGVYGHTTLNVPDLVRTNRKFSLLHGVGFFLSCPSVPASICEITLRGLN